MKQFSQVNSQYGAPMGRSEYGRPEHDEDQKFRLFRVRIDQGGYDDGGAYWGVGAPLWCGLGEDYRQFVRARSRGEAAEKLGTVGRLKRP